MSSNLKQEIGETETTNRDGDSEVEQIRDNSKKKTETETHRDDNVERIRGRKDIHSAAERN